MVDANILFRQSPIASPQQAASTAFQRAGQFEQFQQAPQRQRLLDMQEQSSRARLNQEVARFQLTDAARDALTVKPIIEAGDIERANEILDARIKKIKDRGGDPSDTIALRETLNAGNVDEALREINAPIAAAERFGLIQSGQEAALKERAQRSREKELEIQRSREQRQATKLSAGLEKSLLESQDRMVEAQRNANEYNVLAGDFERLRIGGGATASFSENLKSILGTQDDVTEFRRRFNKVRLSEGLKNLPPGPATDRDVQEAFKGVPKENAPFEQVASFLRGAERLARFEAAYNQFKSDFISDNSTAKGLNREWRKEFDSPRLGRKVSNAELYEAAMNRGITIEEVKRQLGIE